MGKVPARNSVTARRFCWMTARACSGGNPSTKIVYRKIAAAALTGAPDNLSAWHATIVDAGRVYWGDGLGHVDIGACSK